MDWRSSIPADMQMLAVAGTATTLASWHLEQEEFDAAEVEKFSYRRRICNKWLKT